MDDAFINRALESLLKSAKWGPAFQDLFAWVSSAAANDDEIELETVDRALPKASEHLRLKSANWLDLFRKLEGANYGKLILGRHSFKTRFRWHEPPGALALAALTMGAPSLNSTPAGLSTAHDDPAREFAYPFALRHDYVVHVRVPANVTRDELNRLAEFTKLLPGR